MHHLQDFKNRTIIQDFWIIGFENIHNIKTLPFLLFLIIYLLTLSANFTIISLVITSPHINAPMYFFLSHLSFNDILISTTIEPEMLQIILREGSSITQAGCFTQFYFFSVSTSNECLLLTAMSYDRYLAICNPLRYSSIMDLKLCTLLTSSCWVSGIIISLPHVVILQKMTFCASNRINHFYCDFLPLISLSCSDTSAIETISAINSIPIVFLPLIVISVTYANIIVAILRISASAGRQKAFSTCSSHLTVVCMFYGTIVFNYLVPSEGQFLGLQKMISVCYTIVTPLLNPLIYSLRNKEITRALMKCIFHETK
ncbi:olfactory receptor 5V1-like [Spea bombifrons]|uniref:olfactory receptor 5V1-like n=1 Tax=Spea bombifrons TaxID=233779 RepID=UPI00234B6B9A|nr:olfactory receptor 5V1-like [Spea bombifrons]XP_053319987.1 olfactory receptor 5V1-like [Spea bombifrons]